MPGGETEKDVSPWTTDSLKEYVLSLMAEHDRRYEQRFVAQEKAVREALAAAEKAVTKAENASEKRFEGVNEFRATLSDQARDFLPRKEYESRHEALMERISQVEKRLERDQGTNHGMRQTYNMGIAAVGVLLAAVTIVVSIIVANN